MYILAKREKSLKHTKYCISTFNSILTMWQLVKLFLDIFGLNIDEKGVEGLFLHLWGVVVSIFYKMFMIFLFTNVQVIFCI
jgi:hypothetical protein